jgi:opacity protein-like surface antigen
MREKFITWRHCMRQCGFISIIIGLCVSLLSAQDSTGSSYQPVSLTFAKKSGERIPLHVYGMLGYGFPVGGSIIPADPTRSLDEQKAHTQSQTKVAGNRFVETHDKYLNYGQGMKLELGAEIGLMKNVAADVSFEYTAGIPFTRVNFKYNAPSGKTWVEKYKKQCFGLSALVVPHFMFLDLIDVYTGVGIGFFFNTLEFTNSDLDYGLYDGYMKTKPTLGLLGAIGAIYPLADKIDLKVELAIEQLSFTLKELKPTDSQTIYHYTRNSIASNEYQPIKIPGSNWAIKVGVQYKIM